MEHDGVHNRFGLDDHFRGRVKIQGLPDHLALVPEGPKSPDDPNRFKAKSDWEKWADQIRIHRLYVLAEVDANPKLESLEKLKCSADPAYFITMYGYLYEPRKGNGRGGFNPWIPFERQVQMIRWHQWVNEQEDEHADGVLSKCRDVGASWMMCGLFLHRWLFDTPFNGLLVSQKEDFVDSRHPKSLFWKIDRLMQYLPAWLMPRGFQLTRHRIKLFMENPVNGNTIGGESTNSNAGRGDRATEALFDEAAFIPGFMNIWMGAADSTEHRFGVSTESMENGPDWADLQTGTEAEYHPSVFTIDYWEHPLHDDKWYEKQEKRFAGEPDMFRSEILRDPYGQSHFAYPTARQLFCDPEIRYIPGSPLFVAIDPGRDDNTALVWIQFNAAKHQYEVLDGYTNRLETADFYGPILSGRFLDHRGEPIYFGGERVGDKILGGIECTPDLYGDRERELIEWVHKIDGVKAKFIGDLYGDTQQGAAADTWYSVWRNQQGIIVNRDRLPSGKQMAARMQCRTHDGRRKAMRWILPKLAFADTVGARQALFMLQNNQLGKPSGPQAIIKESGMVRDKTTHFTSALEYFAANLWMQDQMLRYENMKNSKRDDIPRGQPRGIAKTRYKQVEPTPIREVM